MLGACLPTPKAPPVHISIAAHYLVCSRETRHRPNPLNSSTENIFQRTRRCRVMVFFTWYCCGRMTLNLNSNIASEYLSHTRPPKSRFHLVPKAVAQRNVSTRCQFIVFSDPTNLISKNTYPTLRIPAVNRINLHGRVQYMNRFWQFRIRYTPKTTSE